jgi:hypothetical protein
MTSRLWHVHCPVTLYTGTNCAGHAALSEPLLYSREYSFQLPPHTLFPAAVSTYPRTTLGPLQLSPNLAEFVL